MAVPVAAFALTILAGGFAVLRAAVMFESYLLLGSGMVMLVGGAAGFFGRSQPAAVHARSDA